MHTNKKRIDKTRCFRKNALGLSEKKGQATPVHNHETLSPTARKIPLLEGLPCGCYTWKHERQTDDCLPMAEQECAQYVYPDAVAVAPSPGAKRRGESPSRFRSLSYELDWLAGKPVGGLR